MERYRRGYRPHPKFVEAPAHAGDRLVPRGPVNDQLAEQRIVGRADDRVRLDMGVDGIMTDYPRKVGALIRKWKRNAR